MTLLERHLAAGHTGLTRLTYGLLTVALLNRRRPCDWDSGEIEEVLR